MEQITLYLERIAALFGPNPYLQAAVIAIVSILVAKVGEIACTRVISRLTSRSATKIDDAVLELIRRPTFLTLVVIGLLVATGRLPVAATVTDGTRSALLTILLLVWMSALIKAMRLLIGSATLRGKAVFEPRMQPLFQNVAQLLIIAFSLYAFFNIWRLDISAWVASAGIVGLALSFAARDTLANLFAGASIIADAPYKVGDFIIIDSGERGLVTHIGLRSTRLLTRDDVEITIPNHVIGSGKIVNEAGGPSESHRIRVAVGVAYGSDIDLVIEVLEGVANGHAEILDEPSPRVRFRAFGNSSLDFELLAWIRRPLDRGRLLHELHCAVYKAFRAAEIEIPFPQRDLNVRSLPAGATPD